MKDAVQRKGVEYMVIKQLTYFGSEKQLDSTVVIIAPSPLRSASADAFDLAATLASFAFCAAMAA